MLTRFTASFTALIVVFGCGGTSGPSAPSNLPIAPPSSPPGISDDTPVVTAISPATTAAGSQQITLSVSGTNFVQRSPIQALVRWTTATGADVYLATRFVSSTEVSATVPATLLKTEGTAEIAVVNGDSMSISDGFTRYPTSNAIVFTITANPSGPLGNVTGTYLATLTASALCASVLPVAARERTYTATLLSDGRINWTGPTLNPPPGHDTVSSGTFSEDVFSFSIDVDRDPMSDDFHGLWDTMDGGPVLNISGKGTGATSDGQITGVLDGVFALLTTPNCRAKDHRFTFVKQ